MKELFIPGFGTRDFLYQDLLKDLPSLCLVPAWDYCYEKLRNYLNKALAHDKAVLSAWSLGSLFALKYSLEYPEKIAGLFLTGVTARFTEKENYANGINPKVLKRMIKLLPRNPQGVMKNFYNSVFQGIKNNQNIIEELLQNLAPEEDLIQGLTELENIDLYDSLSQLSMKMIFFQGEHDVITPMLGAQLASQKIEGASLISHSGGHDVFLDKREAYTQAYKDFRCTIKK